MKKSLVFLTVFGLSVFFSLGGLKSARGWEDDKIAFLRYSYVPASDLDEEDGEIEMNRVAGMAMFPFAVSDQIVVFPGLAYSGLFLDYPDVSFSYPTPDGPFTEKDLPRDLHVIDIILGGNVQWDDNLGTALILYPGIHSDLEDVEGDDVYFSGAALLSYRFSEDLLLSGGFYYDDSFGYPQLLPMLGIQWRMGEDLTLDGLLPQYLVFAYRANTRLAVGLKYIISGDQYRLSENKPWKDTIVKYSQMLAGPFVDITLADHLVLRLEGGFAFNREFEFQDDDTSAKLFDGDIEDSGYAGGSLSLQY